jgi:2,4-dienoyl-CoA reductase-like NADH-dependent reductase (Old Yellow Enzyme family)
MKNRLGGGVVPHLFDPLIVGRLSLKNRIVMAPMANDLATTRGEVTEDLVAHNTRRAAGVGLVIVEHSYIGKDGKLSSRQLGIYDDTLVNGLANLAESIHTKGTPVCIQINHAGRRTNRSVCGGQPIAPSAIPASDSDVKSQENWKSMRFDIW